MKIIVDESVSYGLAVPKFWIITAGNGADSAAIHCLFFQ